MVFPVAMYGDESWTLKKAERWSIDAFELWCWRRLLRVPWTARRSNQYILKKISPRCSLEGLMLKLKLPILWPPHAKSWLIGKDPDAGRDWGQEEKGMTEDEMAGWHHRLNGHEFEWTPEVGDGQGGLACCDSWGRSVGRNWATELNLLNTQYLSVFIKAKNFIWILLLQWVGFIPVTECGVQSLSTACRGKLIVVAATSVCCQLSVPLLLCKAVSPFVSEYSWKIMVWVDTVINLDL